MLPEHTRSVRLICRIDVTAFAAVMIAVLFIMSEFHASHRHSARWGELPRVTSAVRKPKALREDAMFMSVLKDGTVFFGSNRLLSVNDQLPQLVRDRVTEGAERRIYIIADARAKYGNVMPVLDAVRASGIEDVTFLAESNRQELP